MGIKHLSYPAHFIGRKIIVSGVMTVFYFGHLIALVNEQGEIVWRDHTFPKYLVEYLIEYPQPDLQRILWN